MDESIGVCALNDCLVIANQLAWVLVMEQRGANQSQINLLISVCRRILVQQSQSTVSSYPRSEISPSDAYLGTSATYSTS